MRAIFKRSRIIGRRFRIVHVMVGPETIEVTTYRGGDEVMQNEQGRIMRDNTFGSQLRMRCAAISRAMPCITMPAPIK